MEHCIVKNVALGENMKKREKNIPEFAITHAGKFHADDVFCAALLTYLNPNIQIKRVFELPEEYEGIAFDIGNGLYDHHQKNSRVRENGIPYAAFGLLWETYGTEIMKPEDAARFDEYFIQPLDLADNTGEIHPIANLISLFNPDWDSDLTGDEAFEEAKTFALQILEKNFNHIQSICHAETIVQKAIQESNQNIIVLNPPVPWKRWVIGTEIEFVIFSSERGGFYAQAVKNLETGKLKCEFPEQWRGKTAEELQSITGLKTITFCHNGGYLLMTETLEDAKQACRIAQQQKSLD